MKPLRSSAIPNWDALDSTNAQFYFRLMRFKNSSIVLAVDRKRPSMHGNCCSLLHPTRHHAEIAGLYNDGDALRLEHFGEGKGGLLCEPFLDLKLPREHFDYSSDLGEANYSAVGDISDVHLALLACNRLGTGSLIIPSQRMARGGARKVKKNSMSFTITISS